MKLESTALKYFPVSESAYEPMSAMPKTDSLTLSASQSITQSAVDQTSQQMLSTTQAAPAQKKSKFGRAFTRIVS